MDSFLRSRDTPAFRSELIAMTQFILSEILDNKDAMIAAADENFSKCPEGLSKLKVVINCAYSLAGGCKYMPLFGQRCDNKGCDSRHKSCDAATFLIKIAHQKPRLYWCIFAGIAADLDCEKMMERIESEMENGMEEGQYLKIAGLLKWAYHAQTA